MLTVSRDPAVWQPLGRFQNIRWHPGGANGVRSRVLALRTAGFLALFHMLVLRTGPDPISPYLLRFAIEGPARACAIDHAFMRLLDPTLYDNLGPWLAHDRSTALPRDPRDKLHSILLAAGMDVCTLPELIRETSIE